MLYARSDVISVVVPQGCGKVHVRPSHTETDPADGRKKVKAYDAEFTLSCSACEKHLTKDARWTNNKNRMPMTPDEEIEATAEEKRTTKFAQDLAKAMIEGLRLEQAASKANANK